MYLRKVRIKNIKSFADFELDFTDSNGKPRLWTTILGENGTGKSTLLQAIGAALVGPQVTNRGLLDVKGWVRSGRGFGEIEVELEREKSNNTKTSGKKDTLSARFLVSGDDPNSLPKEFDFTEVFTFKASVNNGRRKDFDELARSLYSNHQSGWFACGYGPFRRLSGGSERTNKVAFSGEKLARFVTLFGEDAALVGSTQWLIDLYNQSRDDSRKLWVLNLVKAALQNHLFPDQVIIYVTATEARLQVAEDSSVPFEQLSDGYRTMLAYGIDLLRWLSETYPNTENLLECPGVVLIDELDAHIHPKWQRQIGYWLREKFPNLQFIVGTHSPFLAQVSEVAEGNVSLRRNANGTELQVGEEAVDTWRVDQILTEYFGLDTTRSPRFDEKWERFQELNQKRDGLDDKQQSELIELANWATNLTPAIENPVERRQAQQLQRAVIESLDKLKELE